MPLARALRLVPSVASAVRRAAGTQTVAAVDLGSNSFHMIVARVVHGQLHVMDRLQETVRLGAGLDERGHLSKDAQRRALDCLERFGERLRDMHAGTMRAVGTNTLRRARNAQKFLRRARLALGHPIEVISGREEARLIYQGVARELADEGKRLVLDVGGGSTELILGERSEPNSMESLYVGCVSLSRQYFPKGKITEKAMRRAETAARLELAPVEAQFQQGWQRVYGSSGTIRAVGAVAQACGWTKDDGITPEVIGRLREALISAGHVAPLDLPGLSADRAPVLPGGVAILRAAFEALGIEHMHIASAALREGLLHDLLGRLHHEDAREQTLRALAARYHVDKPQAERVERTARACFGQVAEHWKLVPEDVEVLSLAARLHEIGLAVAHSGYHKHGAYLARYSDLPGFSSTEQHLLALLIRAHRRRFPAEEFATLPKGQAKKARRLGILLRLAVLLHRRRSDALLPMFRLTVRKRTIDIRFPRGWLAKNPLTRADLALEAGYLKTARMRLRFV